MLDISTLPAIIDAQSDVAVLTPADQAAIHDYALAEKSPATRRAYRSDFAAFTTWCEGRALNPIPAAAETVAAFIADQANAGLRASTLGRRVAAIAYAHGLAGIEPPTNSKAVRVVLGGVRRASQLRSKKEALRSNSDDAAFAPGDGRRVHCRPGQRRAASINPWPPGGSYRVCPRPRRHRAADQQQSRSCRAGWCPASKPATKQERGAKEQLG